MGTWTTAVKTWASGTLTSTDMNAQIKDFANSFGAFTAFTPTWTSAGTAPAIGNGVFACGYLQTQKLVIARYKLTMGSTTTYGSANSWTFTLPVTAAGSYGINDVIGTWACAPSGAVTRSNGAAVISSTTALFLEIGGTTTTVTSTVPGTWANTNVLTILVTYEAA